MKPTSLILVIFMALAGCSPKPEKTPTYAFYSHPYPWGAIATWAEAVAPLDPTNHPVEAPYKLTVQFRVHDKVPDCLVAVNSLSLKSADGSKEIPLATPAAVDFEKETIDHAEDGENTYKDWYAAFFIFPNVQLAAADYSLRLNFDFKGDCKNSIEKTVNLPLHRNIP